MKRIRVIWSLALALSLSILLAGCSGGSSSNPAPPLNDDNLNLIFVVSPDLAYNTPGDINSDTANLSSQGLQRSLLMATYLKQQVMRGKNVNRIFTISPMTHLQTANLYPDMAAIGFIQQFAMLNQVSLVGMGSIGTPPLTYYSFPIGASYTGPPPAGIVAPGAPCLGCLGLDFNDAKGHNEGLVAKTVIGAKTPGFYVFSAPWETTTALMAAINKNMGYNLSLPEAFVGSNTVYAIAITPENKASLVTYNSNIKPPAAYPELPSSVPATTCNGQPAFNFTVKDGTDGAKIPSGANTNTTVYMIRHAEAHPVSGWDAGNFVAAGQWRALALPNALRGKISPTEVWSIDPAQIISKDYNFAYVRPSLTVEPYAIANALPFYLVSDIALFAPDSPKETSDRFFTGGKFSNKTILLAWEHDHIPPILSALLASYFPAGKLPSAPEWPGSDYDTIWTVSLDAKGNLSANNSLCEGIDSTKLPETAPPY